jgi:hypothetical protein
MVPGFIEPRVSVSPMDPSFLLLAGVIASLVLLQTNQRLGSPVVAILNRWIRWAIFAFGSALVLRDLGVSDRPFWTLALAGFLVWFLGETLYNWLAIKALSLSPLPLFPRFSPNPGGDEWPTQPRHLQLREVLRKRGFKLVQALRAELGSGIHLRVSVFHNTDGTQRLQVTFFPQPNGSVTVCHSVSTNTTDGRRFVTDNLFLPFGGFYPAHWSLERLPLRRSLPSLLSRHEERLAKASATPVPWTSEPVEDLNDQQREMDRVNTDMGFLLPHHQREEHGRITHEGRYRVWKEYWLLNYFGLSARYE